MNTTPGVEDENVTILWNFINRTDRTIHANRPEVIHANPEVKVAQRTIHANRPDTISKDFKSKTYLPIEMSVRNDQNIAAGDYEN